MIEECLRYFLGDLLGGFTDRAEGVEAATKGSSINYRIDF